MVFYFDVTKTHAHGLNKEECKGRLTLRIKSNTKSRMPYPSKNKQLFYLIDMAADAIKMLNIVWMQLKQSNFPNKNC